MKNHMYYEQTKHIDVGYHFIHDIVSQGTESIEKVHMVDNPTNMLTKAILLTRLVMDDD